MDDAADHMQHDVANKYKNALERTRRATPRFIV